MKARDLNKIKALKAESFAEGDVDDDFLERFAEETGWKSVLLYQYLSGYTVMIALTALITTAIAWLEMMHSIISPDIPQEKNTSINVVAVIYLIDFMYLIDILFRILYAITRWPNKKLFNEPAPIEFITLDIASVIPYDAIYAAVRYNPLVESILRLRVILRLYRIGTTISQLNKMFQQISIMATIFWFISLMLLAMIIPSSIHYISYCTITGKCQYRDYGSFMMTYNVACRFLITNGADMIVMYVENIYHVYSIITLLYFIATMFIVADLACKNMNRMRPMYHFVHNYQNTMRLFATLKKRYNDVWTYEDEQIYFTLKDYYFHFLRQRDGISAPKVLHQILPSSLTKSIIMDMAFDSFRHSHIFRNLDLHIIRFLSTLTRFEFAVPGEVIVRKGDMFNKMIYISHGVLQILSHEDGETPVLNLSGGTSLGETTLFISYPLNCTIICQTYCELVVIEKAQLKNVIDSYPNEYRELVKGIIDRFQDAKKLREIVRDKIDPYLIKSDLLIMSWIKQFQRCFLHSGETEGSMETKIRGIQYYIDNLIFYIPFLDKLVVSEEIELVKDSVFLKANYHFILQPQSPILIVWNIVVMLLTILFILTYPFNLCYPETNHNIQSVYTIFITFIFLIDIYLQISTAVKTRGATYLTLKSILVYRIRQKEFLIDCAAAVPLEYFIIFLSGQISNMNFMLLQANRLVKYYKIICFFDHLNVWSTEMLTAFNYTKYIMHFLLFYYYAATIMYIVNCYEGVCTKEYTNMIDFLGVKDHYSRILGTLPVSISLVTGVILGHVPHSENPYVYLAYTIVAVGAYLLNTLFLVNVISSSAVQNLALLQQQERLLGIADAMDWFEVTKSYKLGIQSYLNTLFYFDSDIHTQFNEMGLPTELGRSFRNIHLTRILGENKFFAGMRANLLSYLSSNIKMVVIPAGMLVFYCGQAIDECYVIQHGHCTMWYGNVKRDVTVNENLGLVEVLLDIPIFHTVITRTDCILMKLLKQDLHRFFSQFDVESGLVQEALKEFARCEHLLRRSDEDIEHIEDVENMLLRERQVRKSMEKKKFMQLFKCANFIKMIKPRTISTSSRFLLYWEITKNIALALTLLLTSGCSTYFPDTLSYRALLLFLDCFSFFDVLMRTVVTYYDHRGLEVVKMSKTFVHYLSHAFAIDVIGAFPFDLFIINGDLLITRMNRYILCYRILGLAYYSTTRIKKVRQYAYIAHFIIFILLTLNIAIYYANLQCDIIELASGEIEMNCGENSWLRATASSFLARRIYSETFLLLLSAFAGVGFRRYDILTFYERMLLALWSIIGHLAIVIFIGRAISYYLFRNADLTTYQDAMRDLVRFLSYCDIDKRIKYEVIQHFEYIWEKRQGKNISDVVTDFPTSVKKDLLFNIYGRYLKNRSSVFNFAEDNFLKSLLMVVKQETFRKTGILYKVDDIHGTIFFLLKGSVEVVGPDTNRLVTLSAGSLFGCLDDCNESRQTLTMVANGHVETLTFSSREFYQLLRQHPKLYTKFINLTNMQFDFIESHVEVRSTQSSKRMSRLSILDKFIISKIRTKILKPKKYLHWLEVALYIFEFFIGILFELTLQVIKSDMPFWLLAYLRDSLWLLRMYLKFHLAFEDEFGMLEFNRRKIALRYLHQKDGFYFDLVCLLPIDCMMFVIDDPNIRNQLFLIFRLNRFLRCYYLFRYMSRMTKKLNINVLLMRTAYILMYGYIYIVIKFILYYWGEILLEPIDMSNIARILNALVYMDTILLMNSQAPVPFTKHYDNAAAAVLSAIICLDLCFQVFFFSNFVATLQIATKVKSTYLKICHNLKMLMLICDASTPLIDRIQMYLNVLLRIRNGIQFPFLLERAPYYLREAVLNSMFGFHLSRHYLFKACHVDFLRQLSATMRTLTFFEGNHICDKGDIDETMYFIQEGVVQALVKDTLYTEVCDHLLVAGESFGLHQILYPRCGQYYAYRASMLTTLVTINRREFTRLLIFFPSVKKHIYDLSSEIPRI